MLRLLPRLASPDGRPAVTVGTHTLTYIELAAACDQHAKQLDANGVKPGDRVAVRTDATLETVIALVGNFSYGAVTVPINPKLGHRERAHIEADSTTGELPADDAALLLYTSGTTGAPKGAVITARNIVANLDALADAWGWTEADTLVHALPLFHVHGLVLGLFGSLRVGGHLHWTAPFDPATVAAALERATMLFGVPTMYRRLAEAAETNADVAAALRSARLLVSGSAGLPVRDHRRLREVAGCHVYERYGLTETLIDCAVRSDGPARPGYVGPPLAGVELRLVDDERRPIDARDDATLGEIAVRGDNVFAGYLNRPDATAAAMNSDGWFYTGDLATRAADGAMRICGRRSTDLIKTGGYKVGAGEVEACLLEADGVVDAAVVGLPDDDLGERIVAFVVGGGDADALIRRVSDELSPHKRPREIRFVDELPRNAMGKVQKSALKTGPK